MHKTFRIRLFDLLAALLELAAALALFAIKVMAVPIAFVATLPSLITCSVAPVLAPVYRESYDTHGQSLNMRGRC